MPVLSLSSQYEWENSIYVVWTTRTLVVVGLAYLAKSVYQLLHTLRSSDNQSSNQGTSLCRRGAFPLGYLADMPVALTGLAAEDTGIVLENVISGAIDGSAANSTDGLPNIDVDFDTSLRPPPRRYNPYERFQPSRVRHQQDIQSPSGRPSFYAHHRDSLHGESCGDVGERAINREGTGAHSSVIG